jgi:hypothetical protein
MIDHDYSPSQFEDIGYETEHSLRKRRVCFNDPVHCIVLSELLQNQVSIKKISSRDFFDIKYFAIIF